MDLSSDKKVAPIGMPKRKRETRVYQSGKSVRETLSLRDHNLSVSVEGLGGQIQFFDSDPTIEGQLIDEIGDKTVTPKMARKLTEIAKLKVVLDEAIYKHSQASTELAEMVGDLTGNEAFYFQRD